LGGYTRRDALRLAAAAGAGAALAGPFARSAFGASTASYDDGTSSVPGGLTGDVERVIVIGAGWAGLACANALRNAGVPYVLLEARDRIGGRAHTADLDGVPVDLGCSWFHQPIGNPLARYADQAGVTRINGDVELDAPRMRYYDAFLDRELGMFEKGPAFTHALNFGENDSATIADELGPTASVRDGAQVYLDKNGLQGDRRRETEHLIRLISELSDAYDWTRLSLKDWAWANSESSYLGIGEGDMPKGGYRGVYRALAGPGQVRLNHRVDAVERVRNGVVVRATVTGRHKPRRTTLRGSHVVVTVPLGVLKANAIRFDPVLPQAKRTAVDRIGFGAVEKVAMAFDEPFWSDLTHTHMVFLSDHAPFELPWWVDLNRIAGLPALVAFTGGPFARYMHTLKPADALALARTRMREMLGRDVPQPRAYVATNWQSDRFARGAYSAMLVGGTLDDFDAMATPVGGRVLFAGEATYRKRYRLADGAFSSGIREAKRLLGRSAVTLSAG
jgi:monoamine oxidase